MSKKTLATLQEIFTYLDPSLNMAVKKTHLAGIDEIWIHLAQSENWGCLKTKNNPKFNFANLF